MGYDYGRLGKMIGKVETKFLNMFFSRFISHLYMPISILIIGIGYLIYGLITGVNFSNANITGVLVLTAIFVGWLIYGLFFTKTYDAAIFENGLILTNQRSKKEREFLYTEISDFKNTNVRRLSRDFGLNRTYRLVAFTTLKGKEIRILATNIAKIKEFGNTLSKAYHEYHDIEI